MAKLDYQTAIKIIEADGNVIKGGTAVGALTLVFDPDGNKVPCVKSLDLNKKEIAYLKPYIQTDGSVCMYLVMDDGTKQRALVAKESAIGYSYQISDGPLTRIE